MPFPLNSFSVFICFVFLWFPFKKRFILIDTILKMLPMGIIFFPLIVVLFGWGLLDLETD